MTTQYDRLSNQARFIQMIIKKELVLSNRKKAAIAVDLDKHKFTRFPKVQKALVLGGDVDGEPDEVEDPTAEGGLDSDFDYLLSMQLSSLTKEKVDRLLAERDDKEHELNELLKLTAANLWEHDLDDFSQKWEVSRACSSWCLAL